jgi:hypothetical protein
MKRQRCTVKEIAGSHWCDDLRRGISPYGNVEYDAEYQGHSHREALRCAMVGDGFLNSTERRWYDTYRRLNPTA